MSVTQAWSGLSKVNWRCKRLGAVLAGLPACLAAWALVAAHRAQLGLMHQPRYPLLTTVQANLAQVPMHPWTAIDAVAVVKGLLDVHQKRRVGSLSM
jgi:hypothetical protein